jgi:hypothetical protein
MKKISIVFFTAVFILFIFGNYAASQSPVKPENQSKQNPLSADVSKVVEKSCFGCHNSGSMNDKAKDKLSFDKLDSLNIVQRIGKIKDIQETIGKGEMPPAKFLERFPDRKLTDDESKILMDWAKKELEQ